MYLVTIIRYWLFILYLFYDLKYVLFLSYLFIYYNKCINCDLLELFVYTGIGEINLSNAYAFFSRLLKLLFYIVIKFSLPCSCVLIVGVGVCLVGVKTGSKLWKKGKVYSS